MGRRSNHNVIDSVAAWPWQIGTGAGVLGLVVLLYGIAACPSKQSGTLSELPSRQKITRAVGLASRASGIGTLTSFT